MIFLKDCGDFEPLLADNFAYAAKVCRHYRYETNRDLSPDVENRFDGMRADYMLSDKATLGSRRKITLAYVNFMMRDTGHDSLEKAKEFCSYIFGRVARYQIERATKTIEILRKEENKYLRIVEKRRSIRSSLARARSLSEISDARAKLEYDLVVEKERINNQLQLLAADTRTADDILIESWEDKYFGKIDSLMHMSIMERLDAAEKIESTEKENREIRRIYLAVSGIFVAIFLGMSSLIFSGATTLAQISFDYPHCVSERNSLALLWDVVLNQDVTCLVNRTAQP